MAWVNGKGRAWSANAVTPTTPTALDREELRRRIDRARRRSLGFSVSYESIQEVPLRQRRFLDLLTDEWQTAVQIGERVGCSAATVHHGIGVVARGGGRGLFESRLVRSVIGTKTVRLAEYRRAQDISS